MGLEAPALTFSSSSPSGIVTQSANTVYHFLLFPFRQTSWYFSGSHLTFEHHPWHPLVSPFSRSLLALLWFPLRFCPLPHPSNDVESRLFQTPISRYLYLSKASSSRQKFRSNSFIRTKSSRQSGIDGDPKSSHRSLLLFSLLLVESWCWVRSWCHYQLCKVAERCDFSSHKAWIFLRNKLQDLVQLPSPQV